MYSWYSPDAGTAPATRPLKKYSMSASPGSCLRAYDVAGLLAQLSATFSHAFGRGGAVKQTLGLIVSVLGVLVFIAIPVAAQVQPQLDAGFNNLYKLKFDEAPPGVSAYEL